MSAIGFIGLGNMGLPMAKNLLAAGHQVTVFDLNAAAMAEAEQAGARVAESAQALVKGEALVITMLPGDPQVLNLYLSGDQGLLAHADKNTLFVDCSTISAEAAKQVSTTAKSMGVKMIDAPVSGGVAGAAAGTLTFMVGGDDDAFAVASPYLEAMGANIFHAGQAVGAGQIAKACNNMLLAALMIGTSEALQLGADNGLDVGVLTDIIKQSSGDNWVLHKYHPWPEQMPQAPASNNYNPGFMVKLMSKDLGLAMSAALKSNTPTPLGAMARNIYRQHELSGWSERDFSSILTTLKAKQQ
ncbi:3-hydroxyisobutyrate dehydrogenase [Corallincola platygyrae]|uniref:3-hydroxyisobutyrate dehydrogenase n=1 Tax=Corallincola platygyrae TaxID=1193278 RepID=A0ABW4XIV3_9GAMM